MSCQMLLGAEDRIANTSYCLIYQVFWYSCSPMCQGHVAYDFIFFFQAEDGIRDLTVTGVQTCALPICPEAGSRRPRRLSRHGLWPASQAKPVVNQMTTKMKVKKGDLVHMINGKDRGKQIGRASCRERV